MPSNQESNSTTEKDISGEMPKPQATADNTILRPTSHDGSVHFKQVWESDWDERKVGVQSKRKFSYVFSEELEWEEHHQRWGSERVEDTDMWEIDLSSVFYVACVFLEEGETVTISDEVWKAYLKETA